MILPTKRLNPDRALLYIGAEILFLLREPKTVSRLWDELKKTRAAHRINAPLTFDWFVVALDMLFSLNAVEIERGRIRKLSP
jgi:hypothetical protein